MPHVKKQTEVVRKVRFAFIVLKAKDNNIK